MKWGRWEVRSGGEKGIAGKGQTELAGRGRLEAREWPGGDKQCLLVEAAGLREACRFYFEKNFFSLFLSARKNL